MDQLEIPAGFTATIVAVAFFSGMQLFFLGIIGDYLGRVYEEVKGRPMFVIDTFVKDGEWNENMPINTGNSTPGTGGGVAVILMLDVLEHIDDPASTLRRAVDLLEPGGKILPLEDDE